jgi:hypothetical protein
MAPIRVLSDEHFNELTTDQKYLYINEMLHYIVASRPSGNGHQPVGPHLERVAQRMTDADYARLPDPQKIRYLETLVSELISTVDEAQRALRMLRATPVAASR